MRFLPDSSFRIRFPWPRSFFLSILRICRISHGTRQIFLCIFCMVPGGRSSTLSSLCQIPDSPTWPSFLISYRLKAVLFPAGCLSWFCIPCISRVRIQYSFQSCGILHIPRSFLQICMGYPFLSFFSFSVCGSCCHILCAIFRYFQIRCSPVHLL